MWSRRSPLDLFLVYEVLYHTPSEADSYELRGLRVVSTTDGILSSPRLKQLELLVIYEFINRWIPDPQKHIQPGDALLSLTRSVRAI